MHLKSNKLYDYYKIYVYLTLSATVRVFISVCKLTVTLTLRANGLTLMDWQTYGHIAIVDFFIMVSSNVCWLLFSYGEQ